MKRVQKLIVGGALVAGALLAWFWLNSPPPSALPIPSSTAATSNATLTSAGVSETVVVDVAGDVASPGVVELPFGSRVQDAVRAAGGLLKGHIAGVNLARRLQDGEQIVIGRSSASKSNLLDLNSATAAELDQLPGVGPVLAARIISYRTANGSFKSVSELDQVSGIGASVMANLSGLVTVG